MTPILLTGDESDDELREIAAHQRELAAERRQYLAAGDRLPVGITTTIPGNDGPVSWPRRAWNALMVLIPC